MSKKLYCIASFQPKSGKESALFDILKALEPNTLREDGCIQYIVIKHIHNSFAEGESYPIVFNEIWESVEAFEKHCQRKEITDFFEKQCLDPEGLVEKYNVTAYSDETR
jgi:quinol monooxygenase YgiN